MELDRLAPYLGAISSLGLAAVLSAPYFLIQGTPQLVGEYYASGPLGAAGAVFLAILGVVIFLSGVQGRADPELIAGIMLVVGLTIFAITILWAFSIPSTVIFSFPAEYSWLEYHPWASVALGAVVAASAALYAAAVR